MKRYPGIQPFTSDDQQLFNGRKQEVRNLLQLIVLNNLVVLFGKSGVGKTSLLQAGVFPALESRSLHSIFFRLNHSAHSPLEQIYLQLKEEEYIPEQMEPDLLLWEYFKKFYYVDAGEIMTPVFIFDQFEELFTLYSTEQRRSFFSQLADVVNGRLPDQIRERLSNEAHERIPSDGSAGEDITSPPNVKIVISLRSDFLYLLDELSAEIPSILRCRFHLNPLDRTNAAEAITLPASLEGNYTAPPFSYSQEALTNIIDTLGEEQKSRLSATLGSSEPDIEAFQLQLLCQKIEEKIIEQNKEKGFVVLPGFYGGTGGVQEIISRFYQNIIDKLPGPERSRTEKMLGQGLVRNGRRIIMEESALMETFQLPQSVFDILQEERLVKKEARKGNFYYEISHDTLLPPILERYKIIEEEEQRLIREKELQEERRKRRRALWIASVGFSLFAIAAIALAVVFWQSILLKEKNIAIVAEAYKANMQLAKGLKTEGKYRESLLKLDSLLPLGEQLGPSKVLEVNRLKEQWTFLRSFMEKGDSLRMAGELEQAIHFFEKADSIDHDNTIENTILETTNTLEAYRDLMRTGDLRSTNLENKAFAIQAYLKALELKPNDSTAIVKLKALGADF